MNTFIYTVKIPAILHLILGFETKKFEDENPFVARKNALRYLSKIVTKAVNKNIIRIYRFKDEISPNLVKLENLDLPVYWKEADILDFKKIMKCKIEYYFNDYVRREAVFNSQKKNQSAKELLDSYGVLQIFLGNEVPPRHRPYHFGKLCFEFKNGKTWHYKSNEEVFLSDYIDQVNLKNSQNLQPYAEQLGLALKYEGLELIPRFDHTVMMKIREMKELFFDKNNLFQKEILKTNKFFEIEKVYLSILNSFYDTYIFVPHDQCWLVENVFQSLHQIYPHQSMLKSEIIITIEETKYLIYKHQAEENEKLIYSKQGKLYFRDQYGVKKADKTTTISEIFEIQYNNPELDEIFKIL